MKNISIKNPLTAIFTVHVFLGMLTSTLCLFLFLQIAEGVLNREMTTFDLSIMQYFYTLRTPPLTSLMFGCTFLASTPFLTVTSICILLFFLYKKKWGEMILFFTLFYMGVLLNLLLKALFNIPRPTIAPLIHENFSSFPSGHSMNGFIFYFSLVYLFYHFTKNIRLTGLFCFLAGLLVLGIGISRIYLGVHFPTDVLGGYIAGLCWISSLLFFENLLPFFRKKGSL